MKESFTVEKTTGKNIRELRFSKMVFCMGILLLLIAFVAGYRYHAYLVDHQAASGLETLAETETAAEIAVHVTGAVASPGLYWFASGSRVQDALDTAGLLSSADTSQLNLAAVLSDGVRLSVPDAGEMVNGEVSSGTGEEDGGAPATTGTISASGGKINLNTATAAELEQLDGIGPVKAAAIIEYRESKRPFTSIEQIKQVSGIGDATYEKNKDRICVD